LKLLASPAAIVRAFILPETECQHTNYRLILQDPNLEMA
jgi:hypothetical protein